MRLFASLGSDWILIMHIVACSDAFFIILVLKFIRWIFITGMLMIGSLVSNLTSGFIIVLFMMSLFLSF